MQDLQKEIERLQDICTKAGVCADCGEHWSHHLDEPFASCDCKTGEDAEYNSPYMKLQRVVVHVGSEKRKVLASNLKMRGYLEQVAGLVDTDTGAAIDWLVDNSGDIKGLLKEVD